MTCLMLIFGELIPQCIAARSPEKTALGLCRFIGFVSVFFAPLTAVVKFFANGLMHIFGIDPESSLDTVTEEEILANLAPRVVTARTSMHAKIREVIELVKKRQEKDNITAALFRAEF